MTIFADLKRRPVAEAAFAVSSSGGVLFDPISIVYSETLDLRSTFS